MASCMTLKRSFEDDQDSNTTPTPDEPGTTSFKRQRRCFPRTIVSSSNDTTTEMSFGIQSVFPDIQPILTAGEKDFLIFPIIVFVLHFKLDILLTRIKEEVRRLQRRHQLKPISSDVFNDDNTNSTESTSLTNLSVHSSSNNQHLLTLKQVNTICARLLKEREEKIREEYDQILSSKLSGMNTKIKCDVQIILLPFCRAI